MKWHRKCTKIECSHAESKRVCSSGWNAQQHKRTIHLHRGSLLLPTLRFGTLASLPLEMRFPGAPGMKQVPSDPRQPPVPPSTLGSCRAPVLSQQNIFSPVPPLLMAGELPHGLWTALQLFVLILVVFFSEHCWTLTRWADCARKWKWMHNVLAPCVRRNTVAVPSRALQAMGYFRASLSKLHYAMHIFFSKSPLKSTADLKEQFRPLAVVQAPDPKHLHQRLQISHGP